MDPTLQQHDIGRAMHAIAETLESKLLVWKLETSERVLALVAEIIEQGDDDALGVARSREAEQEVLAVLDEPASR